ncbi:MAG: GYD domain-containing protein [Dehalococcoidia bacterium]
MPSFIVLGSYTPKGMEAIKGAPDRVAAEEKRIEAMGGKLKDVYYTMGQYDFVALFDFPSDEAMLSFMMHVGSQGNVKTTTLRAFPRNEAFELIRGIS